MRTIPLFEKTPEGSVFDNTIKGLSDTGWETQLVANESNDFISLVMGAPNHLRLVQSDGSDELFRALGLWRGVMVEPGFRYDFNKNTDRSFLIYEGRYNFEAATALARVVAASSIDIDD